MKIKKAFWTSLALVTPATIVPLSTATSCSQAWGYKTPISIGSNIKGGYLDPFYSTIDTTMVDLNGQPIVAQLQSNYAIDVKNSNYYGYSLPEKWNTDKEVSPNPEIITGGQIKWEKGVFEDGNAGWYDYSSSDFVKSATRNGERTLSGQTANVAESIYSYRNNTLASTIQLVGTIGSTMSSCMNYALQYQGTQIGTKWTAAEEKDTNLAIAWGGDLKHGAKDSPLNRAFFESIFASNAVSTTAKSKAAMHPTHVEFTFNPSTFPIPAYQADDQGKITGVHPNTLKLLNGEEARPSSATKQYWATKSDEVTEKVYNIRTDKTDEYKYRVYTYTNVPVLVYFNALTKSFVDPTKNDSYLVSDFYSTTENIQNSIGDDWKSSLPEFATSGEAKPQYKAYTFQNNSTIVTRALGLEGNYDNRLKPDATSLSQNAFVVLTNYAYKEYESAHSDMDRVTMTGLTNIFPAYFIDSELKLDDSFFKVANETTGGTKGYVLDSNKVSKYSNLFFELLKRNSGQGLITEAKDLNETSKKLLKFLGYMFGNANQVVDLADADYPIITTYELDK